jgi:cupin fold WbuC family metalloprotein
MSNVFFNKENIICIDEQWFEKLIDAANSSERKISRVLLHQAPTETVQEMIIAFTNVCIISPNKSTGKSESVHVIRGKIALLEFDEGGNLANQIILASAGEGKPSIYRYSDTPWHTMVALSHIAIVHEVMQGPFVQTTEKSPDWVSANDSPWRNDVARIKALG